ncbi:MULTISPECIES: DUF4262 domain-containing protein [unclassified Phenylobacterium]|jgi:hypothetical protein|uniref:DUF4262 domain-containing protein n=1 Tax=unclassified Phenylobacterium TaxID=2640670 RepID=UPI0009E9034E|nr:MULTISPECIES: DUF4262 domain-containing protein [unclassified Phenylobacterium]
MQTALSAPENALDDGERAFVASIREHGWFRTSVLADDNQSGFSYTTGFWLTLGHPELIVFGLKSETTHAVLWDVFRDLKSGKRFPVRSRIADLFGNHQACLFPVDRANYPEHLGWSRWFYGGDEFPCLQLVWPDREGTFPWETGFDVMVGLQPDISEGGWGEFSS